MKQDVQKVMAYYDRDDEEKRFDDPRKRMEYSITCKILKPYIREGASVLDCSAGAGAYLPFLMEQRCAGIVASDLSQRNVRIMREAYGRHDGISIFQDNALDLSRHGDRQFDVVLCMGPMYHLRPEQMLQCAGECARVLRHGGTMIIAYLPRHFMFWNLINNKAYPVPFDDALFLGENGYLPNPFRGFLGCAYFSTPDEMAGIVESAGLRILEHCAVDMELGHFYEKLAGLGEAELSRIEGYLLERCGDEKLLGASKHNLIICRKE